MIRVLNTVQTAIVRRNQFITFNRLTKMHLLIYTRIVSMSILALFLAACASGKITPAHVDPGGKVAEIKPENMPILSIAPDRSFTGISAMSQNKRFIALDGLGGNYSEIKDLGGGKVTHWYPDEHEKSNIRAISNSGKLIAYLYGEVNVKKPESKYTLKLQSDDGTLIGMIRLIDYPEKITISSDDRLVGILSTRNKKNIISIYRIENDNKNNSDPLRKFDEVELGDNFREPQLNFSADGSHVLATSLNGSNYLYQISKKLTNVKIAHKLDQEQKFGGAVFIGKTNRLAVLIYGGYEKNLNSTSMLNLTFQRLSIAIQGKIGDFKVTEIGRCFNSCSGDISSQSNISGDEIALYRTRFFEINFIRFDEAGNIKKQFKCCREASKPVFVQNSVKFSEMHNGSWRNDGDFFDQMKKGSWHIYGLRFIDDGEFSVIFDGLSVYYPFAVKNGSVHKRGEW